MVKKTNHCTCREKEHIIKQVQKKTLGFIENKFNMLWENTTNKDLI